MCFVAASRSRLIEMLRILHYITPCFCRNRRDLGDFWQKTAQKAPNGGELDVEGAAGHPRSRDGAGRSERRLARSTAREVEKSDCEVRFSARPSLPELEVALPSLHFYVRRLFLWNAEVRTRNIPTPAAPSAPPHATL